MAGKTKTKLAQILTELLPDCVITPDDLHSTPPGYRRWDYLNSCSWFASVKKTTGELVSILSWQPMSQCVRDGIFIYEDKFRPIYGQIEIRAKESR